MSPSDLEPDIDPQGLWQSQKKEYDPMTLAQIHAQAASFERLVHRRNAREYIGSGFGLAVAGALVVLLPGPGWVARAGAACLFLGIAYMAWQLHRRTSPDATPQVGESLVEAYRRQLIRQRDAGVTGFWWYLAPLIPGMALMMVGSWFGPHKPGVSIPIAHATILICAAMMVLVLGGTMLYIRRGVRRLQKMIDEL